MPSKNENREQWEREARSLLAPLMDYEAKARPTLADAAMNRTYASMSLRDIVEFSTTVLVKEHLWSSIATLASLLQPASRRTRNHD